MSASHQVAHSERIFFKNLVPMFLILHFCSCSLGMAKSQVQKQAAPRQRSRGGSVSPPNPKWPPAAPLHLLEPRSPPSRPHLRPMSKPKIQPRATSRHLAAKLMWPNSPRDLCRRGTRGPLKRTHSPSPNPNLPLIIQIVLNLLKSLQRRTCQTNVLRVQ